MSTSNYRPEIDGLRAIAILLVVIYHGSFLVNRTPLLPGGYIGVDVFFVISGYLITRILLQDIENRSFSFLKFYERRARRILPALFAVTAISSIFAWKILMPEALLEYAQSVIATALFSANIFFLRLDNYTAELIAHKPMLHMWSLGIEEQFYIVFPPLLLFIYTKFRHRLITFLGISFLCSLALAEYMSSHFSGPNFYLAPTRVWELVGGSILASMESQKKRYCPTIFTPYLPLLGITAILVFSVFCDDSLRHPSIFTLLPVIGTMLVIWFADRRSVVIQLLSSKVMVGLGLISYSLYLWHQPVFALTRIQLDRTLLTYEKLLLILLCICLALLTYIYIEKPTRNKATTSRRLIWRIAGAGSLIMVIFGITIQAGGGFPERLFAAKMIKDAMYGKRAPDIGALRCENFYPEKGHCQYPGVVSNGYTLFTVGDSHIRTLDAPIVENLPKLNFLSAFVPLNKGNSLFSFDVNIIFEDGNRLTPVELSDYNTRRYQKILEFDKQIIITGGRLPLYLEHEAFDNKEGGVEPGGNFYIVKETAEDIDPLELPEVMSSFQTTMNRLLENGIKVILLYPIPEVGWNVPKTIRKKLEGQTHEQMLVSLRTDPLTTSHEIFAKRSRQAYQVYDSIPDHQNLLRIYPEEVFCQGERCQTHDEEYLFYRDDDHLSYRGGVMLLEHILSKMHSTWTDIYPQELVTQSRASIHIAL